MDLSGVSLMIRIIDKRYQYVTAISPPIPSYLCLAATPRPETVIPTPNNHVTPSLIITSSGPCYYRHPEL